MTSPTLPSPQELVEALLPRRSSDHTIVIVHQSNEANIRFASNKLTTSGETSSTSLSVVSIVDGAYGTCRGDISSLDEAIELLKRSEEIASSSKKAPDYFDLVGPEEALSLRESFNEHFEPKDSLEFFDTATPAVDKIFAAARDSRFLTFGYTSYTQEAIYLGISTGVRAGYCESKTHVGITTKPEDYSRSVWAGRTGREISHLDIEGAFADCRELLESVKEARQIEPGKYTCVLSPSCVADMLLWMYWMMSLRDADEGKTVFSDRKKGGSRLGETLYPEGISLWSDPYAKGVECAPFVVTGASHSLESVFDNGYPLDKVIWIDRGVQASLVSTRQYANTKGVRPSPMVSNLLLAFEGSPNSGNEASERSIAAGSSLKEALPLIANVERGLYVNCLWYIRQVDPQTGLLTGLTRDGIYLIEDGKIRAEVNNFRFNQSPVTMLASVIDAGIPVRATPREFDDVGCWVSAPPITVKEFNMSTVSEAQ